MGIPLLDLAAQHCRGLTLHMHAHLDDPSVGRLRTLTGAGERGLTLRFHQLYEAGKRNYHIMAVIRLPKSGSEDEYQIIDVDYASVARGIADRNPSVEALFEVLEEIPADVAVFCDVRFRYGKDEGESVIPLPDRVGTGLPAMQIRGFRLTALDAEGQPTHSVIIDRPQAEDYVHSITFNYETQFSSALPSEVLDRAASISLAWFNLGRAEVES